VTRGQDAIYNKDLYDKEMYRVLEEYARGAHVRAVEEHVEEHVESHAGGGEEHVEDSEGGQSSPLFVYYAHQIVHVPIEAPPPGWTKNCTGITEKSRHTYCTMLAAVDDSLRRLVDDLKKKNMWDDTILVVTSDNGAMPNVPGSIVPSAGVNFPYRGGKGTAFEGGVKGIGFVTGGKNIIPAAARGTRNSALLHAVDWLPTLVNMAGPGIPEPQAGKKPEEVPQENIFLKKDSEPVKKSLRSSGELPSNLDGFDLWDVLVNNATDPRNYLPLNVNHGIEYPSSGHQVSPPAPSSLPSPSLPVSLLPPPFSPLLSRIYRDWNLIYQEVSGPVFAYDGWFPAPPSPIPPFSLPLPVSLLPPSLHPPPLPPPSPHHSRSLSFTEIGN
jgi:hypothetical protein